MNQNELLHYGVLGMKWGKRKARVSSADSVNTKNIRKKKIDELSNQELKTANERLRLEREYKSLTKKTSNGKKALNAFIKTAGTITAVTAAATVYKKVGGQILDKIGDLVIKGIDLNKLA